ncbi:glycosyltransferase family 2 protein [Streptomyces ureilyticus]|uniref:Glycosyltransferase n=1 Tax=Streptomyces ureilyticus TaxID=1775131 RepID=A0ABX0DQH6_9ACTN|nr:glycosyltransferase family 2 protein [Streptomyces ureilyticus]NGO42965.1 glycosyltransferase [Streptomyces ureilyticus]
MLSVVVPCFNEEQVLEAFNDELHARLDELGEPYEVVFVDDGSTDGTLSLLRAFAFRDPRVRYLSLSRNFGKEAGLLAGLREATGDHIALMDADLQHPPALLGKMDLIPQDNPVADAVFSVGARIRHTDTPGPVRVERFPAPPLVTVHPREAPQLPPDSSPFAYQQVALGHQVYELPRISFAGAHGPEPRRATGPYRLTVAGAPYRITARCRPGSRLYVDGSWTDALLAGSGGRSVRLWGERPEKAVATKPLGTVPADGRVTVTIATVFQDTELPRSPLACLDPAELRRAITDLRARGATHVTAGGHSVRATLPPGSRGTAVIATARVPGWRCAVDDGPMRTPRSRLGLIAVPLPEDAAEHQLRCSFHPPGLCTASVATAGAVVLLLGLTTFVRRRARRHPDLSRCGGKAAREGSAAIPLG